MILWIIMILIGIDIIDKELMLRTLTRSHFQSENAYENGFQQKYNKLKGAKNAKHRKDKT